MAILAVKLSDGSVQITNNSTGVVRTIAKGDKWNVNVSTDYATLYHYDDPQVMVYANPALTNGNSIFGQTTLAGLTAGIISGAIESSSGGGGGAATSPADIGTGIDASADIDTMVTRLTEIRNELREVKDVSETLVKESGVTPRFFIRTKTYNETTSGFDITVLNLDGTVPSPAPVTPLLPTETDPLQTGMSPVSGYLNINNPIPAGQQLTSTPVTSPRGQGVLCRVFLAAQGLIPVGNYKLEVLRYTENNSNPSAVDVVYDSGSVPVTVTNLLPQNILSPIVPIGSDGRFALRLSNNTNQSIISTFVYEIYDSYQPGSVKVAGEAAKLNDNALVVTLREPINIPANPAGDIIAAGGQGALAGNNAQVVTIDVNSRPVKVDLTQGSGSIDSETLRTVTASDSPEIQILNDILTAQTSAASGAVASVAGAPQLNLTIAPSSSSTSQVFTNAASPALSYLIKGSGTGTGSGINLFVENDVDGTGNYLTIYSANIPNFGVGNDLATPVLPNGVGGKSRIRVQNLNGSAPWLGNIYPIYHSQFEEGKVLKRGEVPNIDDPAALVAFRQDAAVRITDGIESSSFAAGSIVADVTDPALIVTNSPGDYIEIITDRRATLAVSTAISVNDIIRTITRSNSNDSTSLITRYYNVTKRTFVSFLEQDNAVTVPITTGEPNQTLGTSGFAKITDGTNTATVKPASGKALVGDTSIIVQKSPNDYTDELITYEATVALSGVVIGDTINRHMRLDNDGSLVESFNWNQRTGAALTNTELITSAPVIVKPDNRVINTAGFQKVTDGTNTAVVRAGSSSPALGDAALVVSLSGNSANMAGLAPSVTANRHGLVGGQYLASEPTLTDGQQAPLSLNTKGSLNVIETPAVTIVAGVFNPLGEGTITNDKPLRRFLFSNTSATVHFLQFHNSAAALTSGVSVPISGWSVRVPANSTLILGTETFGQGGEVLGTNTRWAVSSTFAVYTLPAAGNRALMSIQYKINA